MTAARANFRKIDVTRAIQAARAGGIAVSRVEIEGGKIVIVSASDPSPQTPLDEWLKTNARN